MLKGRLLVLCLKWVILDFPTGCEESAVIVRNYGGVTRAPGRYFTNAKETIESWEKHG